ncbi:MAG: hypothetical protein QGG36_05065 [Pirellulaceae bacterium]|nr:hypothetical protein [Pirellulaceae bacterium]MDP7015144.1 hypothetical protein [Pirellulaceae bacterium]
MNILPRLAAATAVAIALFGAGRAAAEDRRVPRYIVLRGVAPAPQSPTYGYNPGRGQQVSRQTYSYGWFGVPQRRHWSRHFGYHRDFTQWSAR